MDTTPQPINSRAHWLASILKLLDPFLLQYAKFVKAVMEFKSAVETESVGGE